MTAMFPLISNVAINYNLFLKALDLQLTSLSTLALLAVLNQLLLIIHYTEVY